MLGNCGGGGSCDGGEHASFASLDSYIFRCINFLNSRRGDGAGSEPQGDRSGSNS